MFNNKNLTGDYANIVNTKGDGNNTTIVQNSMDVNLVTTIVKGILYDSLPAFQAEAREKVQSSIKDYINDLVEELVIQKTNDVTINNKLSSPDVQYSLYETAKHYAKAPRRVDKKTLINLVVQKINTKEDDFDQLTVLDLAIESSSKMNAAQIKEIAFIHYITNVVKFHLVFPSGRFVPMDPACKINCKVVDNVYLFHDEVIMPIGEINSLYVELYTAGLVKAFPNGELSKASMTIPTVLGCVRPQIIQQFDISDLIKIRTGLDLTVQQDAKKISPLVDRLSILGGIDELNQFILTEVGVKIAIAYLSTKMRLINS